MSVESISAGGNEKTLDDGILIFTAEWCSHCTSFRNNAPELFETNSQNDALKGIPIMLFDSNNTGAWPKDCKVEGYPTVFILKDGHYHPCNERTVNGIVDAYKRLNVP